jgi:Tfp pilus assembly major pilin PilA
MEAGSTQDMEALYRAAVGAKKAGFYVPKFVRFDQPGASKLSWNWPAFFVSLYWFLYRRMYGTWAIYSILIPIGIGITSAILGAALGGEGGDLFYSLASIGYYFGVMPILANSLYHRAIKKRLEALRQTIPETSAQLKALDDASPTSSVWMILLIVPLLGIFAAIAIPAYQDFTIRAQVNEGFLLTNQMKSAVVTKYVSTKSWPVSIEDLNLSQPIAGQYVAALAVDHGTISVTYGNRANPLIAGHVLSFRPSLTDTGAIIWTCGHPSRTQNPDTEIGPNLTDVKRQFLPAECR